MNVHPIKSLYMQNVVLDTNSLIMAISANGEYYQVWQGFLDGRYNLCVSNEILEEYVEVIGIDEFLAELKEPKEGENHK